MLKRSFLLLLLAAFPFSAHSKILAGIDYNHLYADNLITNTDFSFKADLAILSIGYQHYLNEQFSILPLIQYGEELGTGSIEDGFFETKSKVNIKSYLALAIRAQYALNQKTYLFAEPSLNQLDFTETLVDTGDRAPHDKWELGLGIGLGYHLHKQVSAEVGYKQSNGLNYIGFGVKFFFD